MKRAAEVVSDLLITRIRALVPGGINPRSFASIAHGITPSPLALMVPKVQFFLGVPVRPKGTLDRDDGEYGKAWIYYQAQSETAGEGGRAEKARSYCEAHEGEQLEYMSRQGKLMVAAIEEDSHAAASHADAYYLQKGHTVSAAANRIIHAVWPEFSMLCAGGPIPPEVFLLEMLPAFKRISRRMPAWLHATVASFAVGITPSTAAHMSKLVDFPALGTLEGYPPHVYLAVHLNKSELALTVKHTGAVLDPYVDKFFPGGMQYKQHPNPGTGNVLIRTSPLQTPVGIVIGICLDAARGYDIPYRSLILTAYNAIQKGDWSGLKDLRGYVVICSDPLNLSQLGRIPYGLVALCDANKDNSSVATMMCGIRDADLKHHDSVLLTFERTQSANPYLLRAMKCYEDVEVQPLALKTVEEIEELIHMEREERKGPKR